MIGLQIIEIEVMCLIVSVVLAALCNTNIMALYDSSINQMK
jgi:hypothetical protein